MRANQIHLYLLQIKYYTVTDILIYKRKQLVLDINNIIYQMEKMAQSN